MSLDELTNTEYPVLRTSDELAQYARLTSNTHFQVLELCLRRRLPGSMQKTQKDLRLYLLMIETCVVQLNSWTEKLLKQRH